MSQYVFTYTVGNTRRSATIHAKSETDAKRAFSHRVGLDIKPSLRETSISKRPVRARLRPEPKRPDTSTDSSLAAEVIPGAAPSSYL